MDEYALAIAAIAVVVLGRIWVVGASRGDRRFQIQSKGSGLVLALVFGAIVGAGGVAITDLVTRALGVSFLWGAAALVALAVGLRLRRSRGSVQP